MIRQTKPLRAHEFRERQLRIAIDYLGYRLDTPEAAILLDRYKFANSEGLYTSQFLRAEMTAIRAEMAAERRRRKAIA